MDLLLAGTTTSMALMALEKIRFPEFNCNMIVDKHPALIVDSTSLCYNIIFWCWFPWQMRHHTRLWKSPSEMDGIHYSSLQCFEMFSYSYHTSLLTPLELESENNQIGSPFLTSLQCAFLMLNMNRLTYMIFLLINITFCLISDVAFSISYQNPKCYSMAI